jgi:hypothetical protein
MLLQSLLCIPQNINDKWVIVPDGEKSGVSGPIRSSKMYSCVQCAMQEESVCC